MIIECNFCKANVDARVIGEHESYDREEPAPFIATLLECPSCKNSLVAGQYRWPDSFSDSYIDETPERVWPQPRKYLSWSIPEGIRVSIEESQKCISGGAFIASAAMSGRALEGVCRHFKTKSKYLGPGLEELRQKEVIDKRLLEWGRELQKHRNIAAHAGDEKINPQDAKDLVDFVIAICEYVFVLTDKFDKFMARAKA
ncbi:DUF4145 domain-containing protein [Pseudomonas aeruginosa]|uniref:DUF4145 domain-containing protein n=1 Tax=Pseudomonas aeruginosa TaxID=287 RepID=UPI00053EF958|nr:DUF4145 domain-containing protein [Pseudomonas aeruginosa]MCM4073121.1 DUF4145 domain-containing protein [Pseudomonas aeruginosa]MCM4091979.1 DUF4145 domain-containing protein [Pseudomonas aeruginosa]MCM4105690.1 DUF4145 domain-containing protein [Pseudomonas aeruginosa]MCM4118627.1 DUF4145 domain-containing protein [Pseudomonas aeruginosa]MCV0154959.1 DUF4145 domain-containing protein [Pseudomonas aeruginosa]